MNQAALGGGERPSVTQATNREVEAIPAVILLALCLLVARSAAQPPLELHLQSDGGFSQLALTFTTGALAQVQYVNDLSSSNRWLWLTSLAPASNPCVVFDSGAGGLVSRFYRATAVSPSLALVPAGSFAMGDTFGDLAPDEIPVHTVNVSAFYMERTEVSKELWDMVYPWATNHGYDFYALAGNGKAAAHPVQMVRWYDAVKWCNARSELEGRSPVYWTDAALTQIYRAGQVEPYPNWSASGYRLPTEAEWEKAARGGAAGCRFPWTDTNVITHSRANYRSTTGYPYDVSPTLGYHPAFSNAPAPYTSPCGYFATNGFGLYDMSGNVWEWCWDWYDANWYTNAAALQDDTRGPASGTRRVLRGGSWSGNAPDARCANRDSGRPTTAVTETGFRCVRSD